MNPNANPNIVLASKFLLSLDTHEKACLVSDLIANTATAVVEDHNAIALQLIQHLVKLAATSKHRQYIADREPTIIPHKRWHKPRKTYKGHCTNCGADFIYNSYDPLPEPQALCIPCYMRIN